VSLTRKTELASGKITNYEWDYRNRLTKVSSAGQIVEYQYDTEDRRVGKVINGVTKEKYIYDGQGIALVVDAAGVITEHYLYGAGVDNMLSKEANGQVIWSLGDRQGSVVDLVNEQGAVVNHFVYDSFGNRTSSTAADFRFGYTGRELDAETGLYYYRARYYDPAVGRFISEDPIGFSAGDTNLYRYVGNNATNYTDPSGAFLLPLLPVIAQGALTGALLGAATNIWRQNIDLVQSNILEDGRKKDINWGEFAASTSIGGLFGGAAPIAGSLLPNWATMGLVGLGSTAGLASGANEIREGRYGTGVFDILTSLPLGLVWDKFAKSGASTLERANDQKLISATQEELRSLLDRMQLRESNPLKLNAYEIGPAIAGVIDRKTGKIFIGRNSLPDDLGNPVLPDKLHPKIDKILKSMPQEFRDAYQGTFGAGTHAEIFALNDALNARPNASLKDLTLYVVKGPKNNNILQRGLPMPLCPHCDYITNGVRVIPEELRHPMLANILQRFGAQQIEDIINRKSGG
jgi:RHS repeat-associated protein